MKHITRKIEFSGQLIENGEKECYMQAMSRAYELKKGNECLVAVEFVAC